MLKRVELISALINGSQNQLSSSVQSSFTDLISWARSTNFTTQQNHTGCFERMANLVAAAFSCGLLLIAATSSMAFPSGAPVTACSTLTPQHTSPTPCGPNCPFSLALTAVDGNAPQTPMRYRCGSLHTSKMNPDRQVHDCPCVNLFMYLHRIKNTFIPGIGHGF